MTGFCGAFVRGNVKRISEQERRRLEVASRTLSRCAADAIQTFADGPFFVAAFDDGAFQDDRVFIEGPQGVAWVSGDPILTDADGIKNHPRDSAAKIGQAILSETGQEVFARTAGIYSGIGWNKKTARLRLVADKLALRPVYVYLGNDLCLFASNLRTLRNLAGEPLPLDENGIAELVFFGQCLGANTVHRDVRVLRPAEILTLTASGAQSETYFDWASVSPEVANEAEVCDRLYDGFIRAIRRRSRTETMDAFLSGGMDSRCVVAGLRDIGRKVRTFGICYPGSADDVIGRMVSEAFRVPHIVFASEPVATLLTNTDPHALIARDHFPAEADSSTNSRQIWAGDGGSVGMGHVYLNKELVQLAEGSVSNDMIYRLFPGLKLRTSLFKKSILNDLRARAVAGAYHEIKLVSTAAGDRRLFLFYLRNDQSRHLYDHFENIDISRIELIEPFFDFDFLETVVRYPTEMFLKHHLYNLWINKFRAPAGALPWQAYPGHEPCPHAMPENCTLQWTKGWYTGPKIRYAADLVSRRIFSSRDQRVRSLISRRRILVLRVLNLLGVQRRNWEVWLARRVFAGISGDQFVMSSTAARSQTRRRPTHLAATR